MITPATLLADLKGRGINLSARDGSIELDAPAGVVTAADLAALKAAKPEVLALLQAEPEPDPPPVDPLAWRHFVADLPADWWVRWRNRTTEFLFALRRYPDVEDIKAAEHDAYEWIKPLYHEHIRRDGNHGPAWPPRDPRLATWSAPWREAWGRLSNRNEDEGLSWRTAERNAFETVLGQRLALGLPEHGTHNEPGPEAPATDPAVLPPVAVVRGPDQTRLALVPTT